MSNELLHIGYGEPHHISEWSDPDPTVMSSGWALTDDLEVPPWDMPVKLYVKRSDLRVALSPSPPDTEEH